MAPPPTLVPRLFDASRLSAPILTTAQYRDLLKDIHQQLQQEFDNGTCVRLLVTARACAMDEILKHVWTASPLAARPDVALLAVGGRAV